MAGFVQMVDVYHFWANKYQYKQQGKKSAGDLKSPDHCDRAGSSPAPGTTNTASCFEVLYK